MEVSDFLLCEFGVIAESVASLHRIDERIGWRGNRRSFLHGIVCAAETRHGTGESVEFAAFCHESRVAPHLDYDLALNATARHRDYSRQGVSLITPPVLAE